MSKIALSTGQRVTTGETKSRDTFIQYVVSLDDGDNLILEIMVNGILTARKEMPLEIICNYNNLVLAAFKKITQGEKIP